MGCVTSKVMTRTGSFHEELSRSLKRRHISFPSLDELLFSNSTNEGAQSEDICNADGKQFNKTPSPSESMSLESTPDDFKQINDKHLNPETINAWDLMEGLDEQGQLQEEKEAGQVEQVHDAKRIFTPRAAEGSSDITKRSKSYHWSPSDKELSVVITEPSVHIGESSSDIRVRSISFHTVAEYDAIMMETNGGLVTRTEKDREDRLEDYLTNITNGPTHYSLPNMSEACHGDVENESEVIQDMGDKRHMEKDAEESGKLTLIADNPENTVIATKNVLVTSSTIGLSCTDDEVVYTKGDVIDGDETSARRKGRAKDLRSLAIPSTIEFPVIESLKVWVNSTLVSKGQVVGYSPAEDYNEYVTPKFGTSGLPVYSSNMNEDSVFDPEFLSSFQVAMEQLRVEEEFFLTQITKTFEDSESDELPLEV